MAEVWVSMPQLEEIIGRDAARTALTRARAEDVGSEGYIWRTARDGDTRNSHRAMEGRFVKWSLSRPHWTI